MSGSGAECDATYVLPYGILNLIYNIYNIMILAITLVEDVYDDL